MTAFQGVAEALDLTLPEIESPSLESEPAIVIAAADVGAAADSTRCN